MFCCRICDFYCQLGLFVAIFSATTFFFSGNNDLMMNIVSCYERITEWGAKGDHMVAFLFSLPVGCDKRVVQTAHPLYRHVGEAISKRVFIVCFMGFRRSPPLLGEVVDIPLDVPTM